MFLKSLFPRFKYKSFNKKSTFSENPIKFLQYGNENCFENNTATNCYVTNIIALRCVNLISSAVASVKLKIIDETNNAIPYGHKLTKFICKPNLCESYYEFMEKIVSNKIINGNSYIMTVKDCNNVIRELHSLRPDKMTIVQGKSALPHSYIYAPDPLCRAKNKEFLVNQFTGESNIIHIKTFHPLNDSYGLSPLEVAKNSIEQHNQSGEWNKAMLKNGARPSGALMVKESRDGSMTLSSEQYERLRGQIDEYYSGSNNAGRPILLEGGLEWKEMSLSPKDMDFISMKHSTARDIALALGVPPQLIGIPGDNTYNNMAEARLSFWEQTIIPILNSILMHLNEKLMKKVSDSWQLTYNKDEIEIFVEKRQRLWKYVGDSDFMTVNEKRNLFGLPPIVGHDVLHNK